MPEKNSIFETVDPLNNIIYLTHERWYKITNGHPEMIDTQALIKETISDPDSIFPDKEYENTFCYYRKHNSNILKPYGSNIKVVVDRNLQGSIKTAYATNRNKEKAKAIFNREKR